MVGQVLEVKQLNSGILKDVNLTWKSGETLALMGPNGSGKSTLARALAGLGAGKERVSYYSAGKKVNWSERPRWQVIGMVRQHPRRQCIGASVAEELSFGLLNLGYTPAQIRGKLDELTAALGLSGKENQSPVTLSGGERQRLVVGAVLAMAPSFLILDEAFSMLDQRAREGLLDLLGQKRGEVGQLWITHDADLALRADGLLLMREGQLRRVEDPEGFLRDGEQCAAYKIKPAGRRFSGLKDVTEKNAARRDMAKKAEGKIGGTVTVDHSTSDRIIDGNADMNRGKRSDKESVKETEDKRDNKRDNKTDRPVIRMEAPVLAWQDALFGQDLTSPRLKVNQTVRTGEFIGILGPSGAGKTTLLESAVGLIAQTGGKVTAFGIPLEAQKGKELRKRIRLVLQEAGEFLIGDRVYSVVFKQSPDKTGKVQYHKNLEYLARFGLSEELSRERPERLSGGERQLVALALSLADDPEAVLLDEPLLGLDAAGQERVLKIIAGIRDKTLLYVTHDLAEVLPYADRLWLIKEGKIVVDCPKEHWQEYKGQFRDAGVRVE